MHGLITLFNDNHVDNYLKEILVFVYYGSIVNNQTKNYDKFWISLFLSNKNLLNRV